VKAGVSVEARETLGVDELRASPPVLAPRPLLSETDHIGGEAAHRSTPIAVAQSWPVPPIGGNRPSRAKKASHPPPGRPDQRAHQRVVPTRALDAQQALVSESSDEAKEAGAH